MSRERRSRIAVQVPGTPALYSNAIPGNWEAIGTVTTASGTGALVRNVRTGIYCQANAGILKSLPQNKVIAALTAARTE